MNNREKENYRQKIAQKIRWWTEKKKEREKNYKNLANMNPKLNNSNEEIIIIVMTNKS